MKILDLPRAKLYPPQHRCIYCDSTGSPLTLEHIIPYALQGDLELPEAVCTECQKPTWWAEQTCLHEMFLAARTHLDVRTRNPKARPTLLPMGVFDGSPGDSPPENMAQANFRWSELPIDAHPGAIILPIIPRASVLAPRSDDGNLVIQGMQTRILRPTPRAPDGQRHMVLQPFNPEAFARMLTKIAHGLAVAELGSATFAPLLPDFILRRRHDYAAVVGMTRFGRLKRGRLVHASLHLELGYIVARIQLFAQFGFAPYEIVVGRPVEVGPYLYSEIRPQDRCPAALPWMSTTS